MNECRQRAFKGSKEREKEKPSYYFVSSYRPFIILVKQNHIVKRKKDNRNATE